MIFQFCPLCGTTLTLQEIKAGETARPACGACAFVHFEDPKLAAGCIIEIEGQIALVRRAIEPGYGKWVFPGGYVDRGERVEDAARRETREEACLEVQITSLLNVYSYPGRPVVVVVYTADVVAGEFAPADECLEAATFPAAALPWAELAFPSTWDALSDYVRTRHGLTPPEDVRPPEPAALRFFR